MCIIGIQCIVPKSTSKTGLITVGPVWILFLNLSFKPWVLSRNYSNKINKKKI